MPDPSLDSRVAMFQLCPDEPAAEVGSDTDGLKEATR
jgi:hypothetical protein